MQIFNVSALLLDDALLKYVVTEVVLFSVVAFKTQWKKLWKLVNIWLSYKAYKKCADFWTTLYACLYVCTGIS